MLFYEEGRMSFYLDVIRHDLRFRSVTPIRDTLLLEPITRMAVMAMCADAKAKGIDMRVGETFRSKERQEHLFQQGATKLRAVGVHHFGLACDLWIYIGGQINWKADYSIIRPLAIKYNFVWGGDWGTPDKPHSFRDYDHIQRIAIEDQPRLFNLSWYPDKDYVSPKIG